MTNFERAIYLWMAGWNSVQNSDEKIEAWTWRRPPDKGRQRGRIFRGTEQAFEMWLEETGPLTS